MNYFHITAIRLIGTLRYSSILGTRQMSQIINKISKPITSAIEQEVIAKSSNSMSNLVSALRGASETIIKLQASIKGSSLDKTIEGFSVFGKESSLQESSPVKSHLGAIVAMDHGQVYGIIYDGELTAPSLNARWNLGEILQQPLNANLEAKVVYGDLSVGATNKGTVNLTSVWNKTPEQIASVRQSADYKRCHADTRSGHQLSATCIKARHQAASLDHISLMFNVSPDSYQCPVFPVIEEFIKAYLFPYYRQILPVPYIPEGGLVIDLKFARRGDIAQVKIQHHGDSYMLQNLRVPNFAQGIMPVSVRNRIGDWIEQKATYNYDPASCRIEPELVSTFDNKTYSYKINDCEHVLMMDGSSTIPTAVTTKTLTGKGKSVKILAPQIKLEMVPETSSFKLILNGKSQFINRGQMIVEKDPSSDEILAKIKFFQDGVIHAHVPNLLDVITDGKSIELVASQLLRGRAVGLCGDLNGEKVSDVASPRKCIMSSKSAAISYIIPTGGNNNQMDSCKRSIPAQDYREYQREEQQCAKDTTVPTSIVPMFEQLRNTIHMSLRNVSTLL